MKMDMTTKKPTVVLGLDYGTKKMGMAMANTLTQEPSPFDILAMDNGQPDWENLLGIIQMWQVGLVIVGLPLNMDGTDSMLTKRAHKFARRLSHRLGERHILAKVYSYDERLTSYEARSLAQERGWIKHQNDPIDDVSACILLDSYFYDPQLAIYVGNYHDDQTKDTNESKS